MGSLKSYTIGFIFSIALTIAAYIPVARHVASGHLAFSHKFLVPFILIIAVIQLFVQLIFFLHLHKGSDKGWNLAVLISAFSIILILVIGSIWIMNHLNYNMTPDQINNYMNDQGGGV